MFRPGLDLAGAEVEHRRLQSYIDSPRCSPTIQWCFTNPGVYHLAGWGVCVIHPPNHEERKFDRQERKFDETQHHNRIYPIMKFNRIVKNWEYFLHPG